MNIQYRTTLKIKHTPDVFIAGGGPAGIAAAVMAARSGASVYLAESSGSFGGAAVNMLVPAFMQFENGVDFLADGIGREVHEYLNCKTGFSAHWPNGIPVEVLKRCYDDMMLASGASFSFFTNVIDVITLNGAIDYVVCAAKGEKFAVKAKVYIDCTGDGDMCAMAGARYEKGDPITGEMMAATLCALWSDIDWSRVSGVDSRALEQAISDGIFTNKDRHLPGMWHIAQNNGGSNAGHVYNVDGTDSDSMTAAMIAGRRQLPEYDHYYRNYLTGYENMNLVVSAPYIGIRETRRVYGDYVLDIEDFNNRASFPDEIGRYSYPIDIHAGQNTDEAYKKFFEDHYKLRYESGESYGIPYRCLTVQGFTNLLMAGRCISADRYMQSSIRVMPCCYITGQAAGIAAAVCARDAHTDVHAADTQQIRALLKKAGAFLPEYREKADT